MPPGGVALPPPPTFCKKVVLNCSKRVEKPWSPTILAFAPTLKFVAQAQLSMIFLDMDDR